MPLKFANACMTLETQRPKAEMTISTENEGIDNQHILSYIELTAIPPVRIICQNVATKALKLG